MNRIGTERNCAARMMRRRLRISLIAGGLALALPAGALALAPAAVPDLNGDGAVDFCDAIVFVDDLTSGDLRSDFNGDGLVNVSDILIFSQLYCTGPAKTAVAGTATIGVYFDTAGLISQLVNVPASTVVDFYVVAHGMTDPAAIGGYTFLVEENSTAVLLDDTPPAGFLPVVDHSPALGKCGLGSIQTCLGPADPIVLNHYTLMFLGEDTTIEVKGLNVCGAPSAFPSYVSCTTDGLPCDWTYFDYATPFGRAFITSQPVAAEASSWSAVKVLYR